MHSPTGADADDTPSRPFDIDLGFRLSLVLDAAGTVRHVTRVEGIETPPPEVFIGSRLSEISGRREGGPERAQLWEERLALARESDVTAHYADPPPGASPDSPAVVECTVTPVRTAAGELQAIYVDIQDRTVHLAAQQALFESEARARDQEKQLRAALAMTGLGRFTLDVRAMTMSGDARYWEIMGLDVEPFVPSAEAVELLRHLIHPLDAARRTAAFETAMRGGDDFELEYRLRRPDDAPTDERWISAVGRVDFDDAGPTRMVGVVEDITDRRRAEEHRLLSQKREAIGTLAGGIAHDFNNVISAILSNATVARREIAAGLSPLTSITEIASGAVRAADLTRRMLAYGREDEPTRGDVDLGDVVREACSLIRPTLPPDVSLALTVDPALPYVRADTTQLHQVVMNLVANAGQAIGTAKGTIRVGVGLHAPEPGQPDGSLGATGGPYLSLVVRDDGGGMSEAVRRRVFDPFFTTKVAGEGTGLGLAAAQTIIRAHGGLISVASAVGAGATFTCLLPVAGGEDNHADADAGAEAQLSRQRAPRVLFVDDEQALAKLAERALPMSGCEAAVFVDPLEALDAFTAEPHAYDALVTDLSMPGLSGLELIGRIRSIRADLPVVLTSGFLSGAERRAAEASGVDAILPKPCAIGDLADTVMGLVGGDSRSANAAA